MLGLSIRGMVDAVMPLNGFVIAWADALDPAHIDTVFIGIGAALMVRIDPAGFAEMMLRGMGAKRIKRQVFLFRA